MLAPVKVVPVITGSRKLGALAGPGMPAIDEVIVPPDTGASLLAEPPEVGPGCGEVLEQAAMVATQIAARAAHRSEDE